MADSFSASYAEARFKFIEASNAIGARLFSYDREDVRGRESERLSCDVALLGDEQSEAAVLVVTGTHGSEGYCGSAIVHRWLLEQASGVAESGVKIVLLHAINPWAFSHKTRATENNVDLNRNFLSGGYGRANPSYDKLAPFLHGSARDASDQLSAYQGYLAVLEQHGPQIEGQSWEGQSAWPEGIFYTGDGAEWSNLTFRRILQEHLASAGKIGFIDWHTGLGRYGEFVALVFAERGSEEFALATGWWQLGLGDEGTFRAGSVPAYDGLLCKAIGQELPAARVSGAVMEVGTVDDYSLFRADRLDRWLRSEGRCDPDHDRLREDYLNAFCPNDIAWRRFVLEKGPALMNDLVTGVAAWRNQSEFV